MNIDGTYNVNSSQKVIFTAPIKALSNERYLDLKKKGFDVGLETGDFKKNNLSNVICCTQEIYTLKYAQDPNIKVVIDEFHYIFDNEERSRAYIDGVRNTNLTSNILVMSATFGTPQTIVDYLNKITNRSFVLFEQSERATELVFNQNGIPVSKIKDALIFTFSVKDVKDIVRLLKQNREYKSDTKKVIRRKRWLDAIRKILNIPITKQNYDVCMAMKYGIGCYYGDMLPKEKLMMERAFRHKIIDVVVGTDALALGVNLPAETVIFASLVKFSNTIIKKNHFLQMAGRAGRKGIFNKGYVNWFQDIDKLKGDKFKSLKKLYKYLLVKDCESASINILPDIASILKGIRTEDQEIQLMIDNSLPIKKEFDCKYEINQILNSINTYKNSKYKDNSKFFIDTLSNTWYAENTCLENLHIADHIIKSEGHCDLFFISDLFYRLDKNHLHSYLRTLRYTNHLKRTMQDVIIMNEKEIINTINDLDETVFGFEEIIQTLEK